MVFGGYRTFIDLTSKMHYLFLIYLMISTLQILLLSTKLFFVSDPKILQHYLTIQ